MMQYFRRRGQAIPEIQKSEANENSGEICLCKIREGHTAVIRFNPDIKTLEMGLCPGVHVKVLQKNKGDNKVLLLLYKQKYIIPLDIANKITVCHGS